MRKILFIFLGMMLSFGLMAQRGASNAVTVDTIQGAETVNFDISQTFTGTYTLTVQALCTQIGGTSDGTLALYGSVDGTSYSFINFVGSGGGWLGVVSPKASITGADLNQVTITDALVGSWVLDGSPYRNYRIVGVGTSADTTEITIHYTWK